MDQAILLKTKGIAGPDRNRRLPLQEDLMRSTMRVNKWTGRLLFGMSLFLTLSLSLPIGALGSQAQGGQEGTTNAQAQQPQQQPQPPQTPPGQQPRTPPTPNTQVE